ncbi:MAG: pyrroline-5-carboxylate reductase [Thermodesulfobacteriota bacterium]
MYKLGIIGAGKMAGALAKGILKSKTYSKNEIILSDVDGDKLHTLKKEFNIKTTGDNKELAESAEIIIFAVKPGHIKEVLNEIKNHTSKKKLYISIAAGIKTSFIEKILKKELKIVRIMPNKAAVVQEGAIGIYFNRLINDTDKDVVEKIIHPLGEVVTVNDEHLMDAVTGLSGSGPAFVAIFAEALADAGVKMGLHRDEALKLASQTIHGTAKLMIETKIHPSKLKDMVSSPGGTTITGIHELEKNGFRNAVISAVEAATNKSKELSMEDES